MNAVLEMTDTNREETGEETDGPKAVKQLKVYRYMRDRIMDIKRLLEVRDAKKWNMQEAAEEACAKSIEDFYMTLKATVAAKAKRK